MWEDDQRGTPDDDQVKCCRKSPAELSPGRCSVPVHREEKGTP